MPGHRFRPERRRPLRAEDHKASYLEPADTPLLSVIFSLPEVDRRCGSGGEPIAMMQAAKPWQG
jgi:hypothetical protein